MIRTVWLAAIDEPTLLFSRGAYKSALIAARRSRVAALRHFSIVAPHDVLIEKLEKFYYTAALKVKLLLLLSLSLSLSLSYTHSSSTVTAAIEKGRNRRGMAVSSSTAALLLRRPQLPAERLPKHRRSSCLYAAIEVLLYDLLQPCRYFIAYFLPVC